MTRWREAFYRHTPSDKIDRKDKTHTAPMPEGGSVDIVDIVTGGVDGKGAISRAVVGADGADPYPPGARLLLLLGPLGATVAPGPDGSLTITPHPSRPRIPPALLAACRRHSGALARWVGAAPELPLVVADVIPLLLPPLCPDCGTRRWWRPDPATDWTCWRCEPPALAGVEEWGEED